MNKFNPNMLFDKPFTQNNETLDIHPPKVQTPITSLPDNFQIRTTSDILVLEEFVATQYTKGICLYRGHEFRNYRIESTISRLCKNNKNCRLEDILFAEKNIFDAFCTDIFKPEWMKNKQTKTDETLYRMSIGRHLGLPCRLIDVTARLEVAIWFAVMNPKAYNTDGEIILFVLDKDKVKESNISPFTATQLSYSHEPFFANALDDLPLGEQRRFAQNGHFIWVNNESLLNEEQIISDSVFHIQRFTIPWCAKLPLAIELYKDVYSGCAYRAAIERIKRSLRFTPSCE